MRIVNECRKDLEKLEAMHKRAKEKNGCLHLMTCEKCGSKLEIREDEFGIRDDGFYDFTCPVCGRWNLIFCVKKWLGRSKVIIANWFKKKEE